MKVTKEDRHALPNVKKYAEQLYGPSQRFSVLEDPGRVTAILRAVKEGEKKRANSVVRFEKRSISKLLTFRLGRAERNRIMGDANFSSTDDSRRLRETVVTPVAIGRLVDELRAGYWQEGDEAAPLLVRLAVATGATVRPLTETTNAQLQPLDAGAGVLYLAKTKRIKGSGTGRDRPVTIPAQLMPDVLKYYREDEPNRKLFPIEASRFDTMFQKARKRAGLMEAVLDGKGKATPIRPHDLRRVFAMMGEQAGVSRTKLGQGGLGHTNLKQTDRYLSRETRVDDREAALIAEMMGW